MKCPFDGTDHEADVFCKSCFWHNICNNCIRDSCQKDGTRHHYKPRFATPREGAAYKVMEVAHDY